MCKSEIFAEILQAVSRETEVSAAQILSSCKHNEVVDARSIFAKLLSERGFYPVQIADYMHEMQHLCRHVAAAFGIGPYGEEAAYLAGDVGQRMFPVARRFLCDCCRGKMQE